MYTTDTTVKYFNAVSRIASYDVDMDSGAAHRALQTENLAFIITGVRTIWPSSLIYADGTTTGYHVRQMRSSPSDVDSSLVH